MKVMKTFQTKRVAQKVNLTSWMKAYIGNQLKDERFEWEKKVLQVPSQIK